MMTRTLILMVCAAVALSACDRRKKADEYAFNDVYFLSKADKASKEERDHVIVRVKKASQNLEGAREAGRYEATKYCIKQYGTSTIEWVIGPETETIVPIDDVITLEGYCRP